MTRLPEMQCAVVYRALTALVNGVSEPDTAVSPHTLFHAARANHLLLAALPYLTTISSDFKEPLERAQTLYQETGHLVRGVLPQFVADGLPLLAIKSFLPFAYADSNLDLVALNTGRLNDYVRLLNRLGYQHRHNLADVREPLKQMFAIPGSQLKFHLHTAVSWNGIVYLPLSTVWKRRQQLARYNAHVSIPSPEDEFLIMAAHALFENKMISLHEILYAQRLVQGGLDWDYVQATAVAFGWQQGLNLFLSLVSQLAALLDIFLPMPMRLPFIRLAERVWLPYIIPMRQAFGVTTSKMQTDFKQRHWRQIPRQLFSYTFVDGVWMYRKAYRQQRQVTAVCS